MVSPEPALDLSPGDPTFTYSSFSASFHSAVCSWLKLDVIEMVPFVALPPENPETKMAAADVRSIFAAKVMLIVFCAPGHVVDCPICFSTKAGACTLSGCASCWLHS